jgi:hypothetical protein
VQKISHNLEENGEEMVNEMINLREDIEAKAVVGWQGAKSKSYIENKQRERVFRLAHADCVKNDVNHVGLANESDIKKEVYREGYFGYAKKKIICDELKTSFDRLGRDAASWPQVKLKMDDCYNELAPHTAKME